MYIFLHYRSRKTHLKLKLQQGRSSKFYKLQLHVCIFVSTAQHANRITSRHVLTVSVSGYSCHYVASGTIFGGKKAFDIKCL